MKPSFPTPSITFQGSLQAVTGISSEPDESDAQLKRDVKPYDPVLPRLKKLSPPTSSDEHGGRKKFQEPVVRREGSLANVSAGMSMVEVPSDASLKVNVKSYDPVLPRLRKLT